MKFFLYVIVAILILLLMITIHEFGHYLAGKLLGFKIDEFSIGFGPKLFQKKKKDGELFSIRLLPLGGYCGFAGETDEEKILAPEKMHEVFDEAAEKSADNLDSAEKTGTGVEKIDATKQPAAIDGTLGTSEKSSDVAEISDNQKADSASEVVGSEPDEQGKKQKKNFNEQPPWKRIIVLMAGGVFNLLSAVIFSFIFIAAIGTSVPTVVEILPNVDQSVFESTLQPGDEIKKVDGKKIDFYHPLSDALAKKSEGDVVTLTVLRDGNLIELENVPIRKYYDEDVKDGNYPKGLGVSLSQSRASIGEAFKYCVPYTAKLSWLILGTFGKMIIGQVPIRDISGPIGTVRQMAEYGTQSAYYFLLLMPLIAANLGIFNLFPIPALDGSKVVFTVIEWIRGKPINPKVEGMIHFVGLIVLFGLVIILDIVNLVLRI